MKIKTLNLASALNSTENNYYIITSENNPDADQDLTLVSRIIWDSYSVGNNVFIELIPLDETEPIIIYNTTGHYESPEGIYYKQVKIFNSQENKSGVFSYYYIEQEPPFVYNDDFYIKVNTQYVREMVTVEWDNNSEAFFGTNDLVEYYKIGHGKILAVALTLMDLTVDRPEDVSINGIDISLKDGLARNYSGVDINSLILQPGVRADLYVEYKGV